MPDLTAPADNPGSPAAANPSPGPAQAPVTGQAPAGQPGGSGPSGDTFWSGDVNSLPPQLRPAYDSMLRDYREKTGGLSEERKALAAAKEKAAEYDKLVSDQEFVQRWNDYITQKSNAQPEPPADPKIMDLERRLAVRETADFMNAFAEAVDDKGQKIRDDFDRLNGIMIGENVSLLNACIQCVGQGEISERVSKGYDLAKKVWAQVYDVGYKAGRGKVGQVVRDGTEPPTPTAGQQVYAGDPKKITPREAVRLARQGITVPRD